MPRCWENPLRWYLFRTQKVMLEIHLRDRLGYQKAGTWNTAVAHMYSRNESWVHSNLPKAYPVGNVYSIFCLDLSLVSSARLWRKDKSNRSSDIMVHQSPIRFVQLCFWTHSEFGLSCQGDCASCAWICLQGIIR